MKNVAFLFAAGLILSACESTTNPASNVEFNLSGCLKELGKASAGSSAGLEGELIFQSKDSLSMALPMVLLCKGEYAMLASVASPETLSISVTDIGSDRSKCVCEKSVTFGYKSPGPGLESIHFVKAEGQVFELK